MVDVLPVWWKLMVVVMSIKTKAVLHGSGEGFKQEREKPRVLG